MESIKRKDPILNVVKDLLRDKNFMDKDSEEQWGDAHSLLVEELKGKDKETKRKSR